MTWRLRLALAAGDQDIDRVHRLDEAGHAGHVVDANRGGAHAVGKQISDRRAKPLARQLGRQDRLVESDRPKDDPALTRGSELVVIREASGRQAGARIVDELHLVRRDVDPVIERDGGDGDLGRADLCLLDPLVASA